MWTHGERESGKEEKRSDAGEQMKRLQNVCNILSFKHFI